MMKKRLRPAAAAAAVAVAAGLLTGCVLVDNTSVATVNDEKIGKGEFAFYFSQMQSTMLTEANPATVEEANAFWETTEIEGKKAADVARERALDEAVKTVLKTQKAAELGVELTDDDKQNIDMQIGQVITNMGGKSQYEAELKSMGTTADGYQRFLEQNVLASKVDEALTQDPAYAASDEEARAAVEKDYVKAEHILLMTVDPSTGTPYDDAKIAEQKQKAEDLLSQIQAGANFEELMNANSEDTGLQTAPEGYVFTHGEMVAPFEEAAYALAVDEVSGIVETDYGYHIIKRVAMTEEDIQSKLEEARQSVEKEKIDGLVEQWRTQATIVVDEKALSKMEVTELEESAA